MRQKIAIIIVIIGEIVQNELIYLIRTIIYLFIAINYMQLYEIITT